MSFKEEDMPHVWMMILDFQRKSFGVLLDVQRVYLVGLLVTRPFLV